MNYKNNIFFIVGNHDFSFMMNNYSGLSETSCIEEKYDFDYPQGQDIKNISNYTYNKCLNMFKQWLQLIDMPFIYYSDEYSLLASHTIQYPSNVIQLSGEHDYISDTVNTLNEKYNDFNLNWYKGYNYYFSTLNYIKLFKIMFKNTDFNGIFDYSKYFDDKIQNKNVLINDNLINFDLINDFLKELTLICVNNIEHIKNNSDNFYIDEFELIKHKPIKNLDKHLFIDLSYCIVNSFLWQRPREINNKMTINKNELIEYMSDNINNFNYKFRIIGHSRVPINNINSNFIYLPQNNKYIIFNDYSNSSKKSIYSHWMSFKRSDNDLFDIMPSIEFKHEGYINNSIQYSINTSDEYSKLVKVLENWRNHNTINDYVNGKINSIINNTPPVILNENENENENKCTIV